MFCILIRVCCVSGLHEPLLDGDQGYLLDALTDILECDRDNLEAGPGQVEAPGWVERRGHCCCEVTAPLILAKIRHER